MMVHRVQYLLIHAKIMEKLQDLVFRLNIIESRV